jgi:hypothetical protein
MRKGPDAYLYLSGHDRAASSPCVPHMCMILFLARFGMHRGVGMAR